MNTNERVRRVIADDLGYRGSPSDLTDDFDLIDNHVVDSVDMLKLISLLEQEFGVEVKDEELVPQNFGTVASIAAFIDTKRAG